MELHLVYRGKLPAKRSRGVSPIKSQLRASFHSQIQAQVEVLLSGTSKSWSHLESEVDGIRFRSPVHSGFATAANLEVTMLVPSKGRRAGDLDNRIKTLVDGLTRPANSQQLQGYVPPSNFGPTYCLLDDDGLVQGLSVETRPWYDPGADADEALVLVKAKIVPGRSFGAGSPVNNLIFLLG